MCSLVNLTEISAASQVILILLFHLDDKQKRFTHPSLSSHYQALALTQQSKLQFVMQQLPLGP